MKLNRLLKRCTVGAIFLLAGTASWAAPTPKDPHALQVLINLPPTTDIILENQVTDELVTGLQVVLQREGFAQPVEEYDFGTDAKKVPYLLTMNVIEWQMKPGGFIDCTFTANLQTPNGTRSLGIYHDSSFHLRGSGRWTLAREYDEAATGALNQLVRDIARKDLLPDLHEPAA